MKHIGNFKNSLGTLWEHIGTKKKISKIHEVSHLIHNIDVWKGVRESFLDDETYESLYENLLKLGPKWI
jgi:hypothetical protein